MATELFLGFVVFAVVTLFTPGPNNVMLLSSGLNFGFRGALPHLLGVSLGFSSMMFIVGTGLGAALAALPGIHAVIRYVGAAYMLYLAWLIAHAGPVEGGSGGRGRPIGFVEAVAFQWVNPKAWVMILGATATYAGISAFPLNMALMAAVFLLFGLGSSTTWVLSGTALARLVRSPGALRTVNVAMALLLVLSLVPVFIAG